ncbi:hypothetical protein BS47DRAFT_1393134 [Hydnum rufescens UP504]|uniref:Uncharacterized protein n=1 Tax=Hydnum rufescens UP504 TaxID=1448309 RepID=A0A9P6DWH4_9AGAM|nr:hypothetical protein BS47DRAFT_1393134 [Hydnum rufescens UP504]
MFLLAVGVSLSELSVASPPFIVPAPVGIATTKKRRAQNLLHRASQSLRCIRLQNQRAGIIPYLSHGGSPLTLASGPKRPEMDNDGAPLSALLSSLFFCKNRSPLCSSSRHLPPTPNLIFLHAHFSTYIPSHNVFSILVEPFLKFFGRSIKGKKPKPGNHALEKALIHRIPYSLSLDDLAFSCLHTRRHSVQSLPASPPPPYVHFKSHGGNDTATMDINWSCAEPLTDDIERITHGEGIKAKLRYKLHKLQHGKRAEPWDVLQNRFLRPGEEPRAPLDSPLWKLPKSCRSSRRRQVLLELLIIVGLL